jgi:hypothetical protein
MWEPRRLTSQWASTACYRDNFTFTYVVLLRIAVVKCRSQWPLGLRQELPSLPRTVGSWVRIPLKAWISVCIYSVFVLGSCLATGWSPVQGVLPTLLGLRNWNETKRFTDALCSKVGATGKRERENCRTLRCGRNGNTWHVSRAR